jgi:hypothetical protein
MSRNSVGRSRNRKGSVWSSILDRGCVTSESLKKGLELFFSSMRTFSGVSLACKARRLYHAIAGDFEKSHDDIEVFQQHLPR